MTETRQMMLSKAEEALWAGDRRTAGILLHKVLLQDFTNSYAWQLLHAMLGAGQPFEEFQHSFAQKYYPGQAFLLQLPAEKTPVEMLEQAPPAAGEAAERLAETIVAPEAAVVPAAAPVEPLQAAIDLGHTEPLAVERPYMLMPDMTCPICSKPCPPRSRFCIYCGVPIEATAAVPVGSGSLLLYRPRTTLAQERIFSIWVDGKQVDEIVNDEHRQLSLPSGPHTLVVKSQGRSSQSLQFTVQPGGQVRLVVQAARSTVRGVPPDLWVFPFHEEGLYRRERTRKEQFWLVVRTLLIILLLSGFAGMITYIAFYMAWN